MPDLKVSIIQTSLFWEQKEENLTMFSQKINAITEETDLIILPEMFTTGFSMKPSQFAEKTDSETLRRMRSWASDKNCAITGSIIVKEKNSYYNRLIWVRPDGTYETYDKRHLFRFAGEHQQYSAGSKKLIVDLKGWKICPLICFDLRFPVWSRNLNQEYDCLIYVANWPAVRSSAWSTLLQARAHENQCYVVGVNRIGNDGNAIPHSGNSGIIEPKGDVISTIQPNEQRTETIKLSWYNLESYRKKFPISADADNFKITS
ncbi:MAG: amidohydrolase [Flavobacteriales bacterium]|jgi:omega-amidase|nr:amidohydrolase [Flavobacteriales bacterium]MBT6746333.1 amidohydrolase [Flavobacteriales bacterium]